MENLRFYNRSKLKRPSLLLFYVLYIFLLAVSRLAWFNFRLTRCGNKAQKWYKRLWNCFVVAGLVIMMQQLCHSCCCTCSPRAHYVTKCQTMPPLRFRPPFNPLSPTFSLAFFHPLCRLLFFASRLQHTNEFWSSAQKAPMDMASNCNAFVARPSLSSHFTDTLGKN